MTIVLWLLSLALFLAFMVFSAIPINDTTLILSLGAIIIGLFALITSRKIILLVSFLFILFAELVLYSQVLARGLLYYWLGAMALTLFFGVLTQRQD